MDLTDRWPPWGKIDGFDGFQKLATGLTVPTVPSLSPAGFDVVRRQRIQQQGNVFYGTLQDVADPDNDDTDILNAEAGGNFDQTRSWENDGAMRNDLENALSTSSALEVETVHYITLSPWDQRRRSSLGLPPTALVTNDRMRATPKHIQGLHSSAIQLNLHPSFDLCHKEEVDLQSTSLLWGGAPVVWVVISPMHSAKFEARLVEHLHISSQCSQFVRHHQLIVPPSLLDAWGIEFSIFAQVAGEAVRLNHQTYYYQWHLGANLLEKITGCELDWYLPPMYQYCQAGDVRCKSQPPITAANMEILAPHPLELCDEPGGSLGTSIIAPTIEKTTSPSIRSPESGKDSPLFVQQDSPSESSRPGLFSPTVDSVNDVPDVVQSAPGSPHSVYEKARRGVSLSFLETEYLLHNARSARRLPSSNFGLRKHTSPASSTEERSDVAESDDPTEGIDDLETDREDSNLPDAQRQVESASLSPLRSSLSRHGATPAIPSRRTTPAFLESTLPNHSALDRITVRIAGEGSSTASVNVGNPAMLTPPSTGKSTRNRRTREPISREMHDLEIDQYIEFGIQNRNSIAWKYISPGEAGEVLSRFRPQVWLSTSAIMETLYHLADTRPDVHVVNAHSFSTARRTGELDPIASRWDLATIVLIPVHLEETDHWFLVSLDLQRHIISMHENSIIGNVEDLFVDYLVDQDAWTLEHPGVLANDGHNCGIILLKEAEAILRPETDIPNDFNQLRQRYVRMVVQGPLLQDLPSGTPNSRAQSSELSPPGNPSNDMILSSSERETPLSHTELAALAAAVGCDEVLDDLEGLMETLRATPTPGIEQATQLYIDARDNLVTEAQKRSFVADMLRHERPQVDRALQIYAMDRSSVAPDGRGLVPTSRSQSGVNLYTQGESLEILGHFQKSLAGIFLARIFELLVKHYRDEKMAQQEAQKKIKNHVKYRRRREAQGFKVIKRRSEPKDLEVTTAETSGTSVEKISAASMRHAVWKAYDLLAGDCEPKKKEANRKTVKSARYFGSQLLAYEAECGPGWPLWMFIPTRQIPSPANVSYNVTENKILKLRGADRQLLVSVVRTNSQRLWQALPRFAENIHRILRGEEIGFGLLRDLR